MGEINMVFYICCTQKDNVCPKKDECRRYQNAKTEVSWSLFKYVCTEDSDFPLFMERETIINETSKESEDSRGDEDHESSSKCEDCKHDNHDGE